MPEQSPHLPVMLDEVVEALDPRPGNTIVDGTFGAGGYSRALLDRQVRIVGLDRDRSALSMAAATGLTDEPLLNLHECRFSELLTIVEPSSVDGVVLDIGVSSMQLDRAERGFSFLRDGPLDMRMSAEGPSAADVVNELSQADLLRVIGIYGEERNAPKIARKIVEARRATPITTTERLAELVEDAVPRRAGDRIHPSTRTFQGLRIYVNDELGELAGGLVAAEQALKPGGVLAVVTFHSLEDRMVKKFFADRFGGSRGSRHMPNEDDRAPTFEQIGKQGLGPTDAEIARNPRARSARLRAGRRLDATARTDRSFARLPDLPPVHALGASR